MLEITRDDLLLTIKEKDGATRIPRMSRVDLAIVTKMNNEMSNQIHRI